MVFDNLVYGHEWAVKWGPFIAAISPTARCWCDAHQASTSVDAVVHFAAYAYVGESVTNPRKYYGNNVAAR